MMREISTKVAILGAGTAGMSASKEVAKSTDDFLLIDGGRLGTTCARVGCMPSKALIEVAHHYHDQKKFKDLWKPGSEINIQKCFEEVRSRRDQFVSGVLKALSKFEDKLINEFACFENAHTLRTESYRIRAEKIILCTGTSPIIPKEWKDRDRLFTSDDFFEILNAESSWAVVGLGVIGLELGQALSRLGLEVKAYDAKEAIGGLKDPKLIELAKKYFKNEFSELQLERKIEPKDIESESVLMSVGRQPDFGQLQLERAGIQLNKAGLIDFEASTMTVRSSNHIFVAGDFTGDRPILHEAADEGRIAGFNSTVKTPKKFKRRCPMSVVFSSPQLGRVGKSLDELESNNLIIGEQSFENQGRSVLKRSAAGMIRIYADKASTRLLGAEMIAPDAEHLTHLLASWIQMGWTAFEALSVPYYHPTVEEGLRSAVRDIVKQYEGRHPDLEVPPCEALDHECL